MPWQGEIFKGRIGFPGEDSVPHWDLPPRPPEGSPNVPSTRPDSTAAALRRIAPPHARRENKRARAKDMYVLRDPIRYR
jgi:hypothetical protein